MTKEKITFGFKNWLQAVRLVVWPAIVALLPTLVWHQLKLNGWHSPTPAADEPTINFHLPAMWAAHIWLAVGFMRNRRADNREIRQAAMHPDDPESKEKFLLFAGDVLPLPWKFVLFVSAMLILGWTSALYYATWWHGAATVYTTGYFLTLIWEVIADLDDPANGVWVIKGVPEEWINELELSRRMSDRATDWLAQQLAKVAN